MAKFGEADDRWIVKDLGEQGTNVNNWHWKEVTHRVLKGEQALITGLEIWMGPGSLICQAKMAEQHALRSAASPAALPGAWARLPWSAWARFSIYFPIYFPLPPARLSPPPCPTPLPGPHPPTTV